MHAHIILFVHASLISTPIHGYISDTQPKPCQVVGINTFLSIKFSCTMYIHVVAFMIIACMINALLVQQYPVIFVLHVCIHVIVVYTCTFLQAWTNIQHRLLSKVHTCTMYFMHSSIYYYSFIADHVTWSQLDPLKMVT